MRDLAQSLLFLVLFLFTSYANAQDEKITPQEDKTFKSSIRDLKVTTKEPFPDISKMSEQEINKLPEEVLKKLPMKEVFGRSSKKSTVVPLMENAVSLLLGRLMYFSSLSEKEIRSAVKKFQRDIGETQTGELTLGQFKELSRRSARFNDTPIYLHTFGDKLRVFSFKDEYVSTQGTWIIEGEKIWRPINHSEITCYKNRSTCELDQVEVGIPSIKEDKQSYSFSLSKERYDVISWTTNEVIA